MWILRIPEKKRLNQLPWSGGLASLRNIVCRTFWVDLHTCSECIQDVESQRPLLIWWSSNSCLLRSQSLMQHSQPLPHTLFFYVGTSILLLPTQRGLPEVTLDLYLPVQSIHPLFHVMQRSWFAQVQCLNDTWHLQRQLDISRAASMKGLRVLDLMYQDTTLAEDTSPKQMPTTCSNDLNNPHCISKSYISNVLFM